jgi:hypothetical protein
MSILTHIEFITDDGNDHSITIDDARALYKELHELFGEKQTTPVGPLQPYNPMVNPYTGTGPSSSWSGLTESTDNT